MISTDREDEREGSSTLTFRFVTRDASALYIGQSLKLRHSMDMVPHIVQLQGVVALRQKRGRRCCCSVMGNERVGVTRVGAR